MASIALCTGPTTNAGQVGNLRPTFIGGQVTSFLHALLSIICLPIYLLAFLPFLKLTLQTRLTLNYRDLLASASYVLGLKTGHHHCWQKPSFLNCRS